MRLLAALLSALTCCLLTPAFGGPAEDETFAAFEWFCLEHANAPNEVPGLFENIGIAPLPDDRARPFLTGQSGQAWFVFGQEAKFVVTMTERGACGVANPYTNGEEVKRLFRSLTRNRSLNTDRNGSEITETYAVSHKARSGDEIHTVVLITTSALNSIQGINLGSVPERIMKADGLKIPMWP